MQSQNAVCHSQLGQLLEAETPRLALGGTAGEKIGNALLAARLIVHRLEAACQAQQLSEPVEAALYLDSAASGMNRLHAELSQAAREVRG